ncbi:MAG: hypothetical protein QOI26_650, partial [Pseudonocardiales bacterium]|nr:hypothetical protein [Pseudonocardiales bacterium]
GSKSVAVTDASVAVNSDAFKVS